MGCNLEKVTEKTYLNYLKEENWFHTNYQLRQFLGVMRNVQCALLMSLPHVKKKVMKMDLYKSICDQMQPYAYNIEKFDFWCLGEPTIDPFLVERIYYEKIRF